MSETPTNKLRELCEKWQEIAAILRNGVEGNFGIQGALAREAAMARESCASELRAILPDVERLVEALRWALVEGRKGFYVVEDGAECWYHCKFCHAVSLTPETLNHEAECKLFHAKTALALVDQPVAPKEIK